MTKYGALTISWGNYGGFYLNNGYTKRLCIGWVAITYWPLREDMDDLLRAGIEAGKND